MAPDFHLHDAIGFRRKSAFRNRRRSLLTIASIAFTLLLLAMMVCVWRSFYNDKRPPDSALRIMTRHKVSLANFLPIYDRDKIRAVPGVLASLTQQNPACVAHKEANSPWR
jgi:putative ABC transport system permease protein